MKNINWILHGVSLAAILFLYYQNDKCAKQCAANKTSAVTDSSHSLNGDLPIAYFYTDSLLANLGFFKEGEKSFKKKQEAMQNELRNKEINFQREVQKIQENAENMTRNELEAAQKRLAKMEQEILERKEKLSIQFAEETSEFNEKLHKKVISYLKEMNADGRYKYIFSVSREGNIFYSDPAADITKQMIQALNEKYSTN